MVTREECMSMMMLLTIRQHNCPTRYRMKFRKTTKSRSITEMIMDTLSKKSTFLMNRSKKRLRSKRRQFSTKQMFKKMRPIRNLRAMRLRKRRKKMDTSKSQTRKWNTEDRLSARRTWKSQLNMHRMKSLKRKIWKTLRKRLYTKAT